jgi:acetyl esterase
VRAVLAQQGHSATPEPVGNVEDGTVVLGNGTTTTLRVYTPQAGPFPLLLYIHSGGRVIATIDTYDASARALYNAAGAIVVLEDRRRRHQVLIYRAVGADVTSPSEQQNRDSAPLDTEGRAYADALGAAGVPVRWANFEGVTHEFFGMGAVVDKARDAVALAATDLKAAFARA